MSHKKHDLIFARQMVESLRARLLDTAGSGANMGVRSLTIDGTTVVYDRSGLSQELTFWEKKLARMRGERPVISSLKLNAGT